MTLYTANELDECLEFLCDGKVHKGDMIRDWTGNWYVNAMIKALRDKGYKIACRRIGWAEYSYCLTQ